MINVSFEKYTDLYRDYRLGLHYLKQLDFNKFEYPNEVTYFHVYTEVKTENELECIKSYFATQNLQKTKLVIQSDYDISNQENIKEYKDKIDFRIYNPIEEAKGTILENHVEKLLAKDGKYYLQSDLLRLLALHKYGGIWIDMDIILLRDFKPILDQEFLYQWGGDTNFSIEGCCATVISLKKDSKLSQLFLEEILNMPIIGSTTIWGKDLFARVYRKNKFDILPSSFFNIEWLISKVDKKLSEDILDFWFDKECPDELLFLDCFAWHWQNSTNKNKTIQPNSKFDKLRKYIDSL